jgi:hypothetical protein
VKLLSALPPLRSDLENNALAGELPAAWSGLSSLISV